MVEAKTEYKRLDRAAKARIDEKKHGVDGPVRIGRFIITQTPDDGGPRAFDVAPSVRIGIKKMGD